MSLSPLEYNVRLLVSQYGVASVRKALAKVEAMSEDAIVARMEDTLIQSLYKSFDADLSGAFAQAVAREYGKRFGQGGFGIK